MAHDLPARLAICAALMLLSACGNSHTSSTSSTGAAGTLKALAAATDRGDDTTIKQLTCPEKWLSQETFAAARQRLAAVDPRLADLGYQVSDLGIRTESATTATGAVHVTVTGVPKDLSPDAQNAMAASPAPLPVQLFRNGIVHLVKRNGTWMAC